MADEHGSRLTLPPGAAVDEAALTALAEAFGERRDLWRLQRTLAQSTTARGYDAMCALVEALVLDVLPDLGVRDEYPLRWLCARVLSPEARLAVARRFCRDRRLRTRRWAIGILRAEGVVDPEGWDWLGFEARTQPGRLYRHETGTRIQAAQGVMPLETVGQLRERLGISSPRQLGWMLLASDGGLDGAEVGPYTTFTIPKSDGSPREIAAPRAQLKWVQRRILRDILSHVPAHESAHGFVPGRSTVTNAAPHVGQDVLIKFDLQDFFPTVRYWRVLGLFAQLGYGQGRLKLSTVDDSRAVAPVLARLCTYAPDPYIYGGGHTPQGAPTSPAICNLVCRSLDARFAALAEAMGGAYTRYADDLTFSFPDAEAVSVGRLRWWVGEITMQEGFALNHRKFRVIRRSQRQQVTGVVVNDKLTVPRRERRRFRAILHNCRRHGLASQARGRKDFADYLRGYASYVHMVQPEVGRQLLDEVEAILATSSAPAPAPDPDPAPET